VKKCVIPLSDAYLWVKDSRNRTAPMGGDQKRLKSYSQETEI